MTPAGARPDERLSDAASEPGVRPELVLRAQKGFPSLGLRELWRFRDLAFSFANREMRLRYRQTALGVLWFVLQPLILAATFTFIFGAVARMPAERAPRLVFTLAGVLAWNFFSHIVARGGESLVANAALITKVFFPRELLPLSMVFLSLVDLGVAFALFAVVIAASGIVPSAALALLPVWILLLALLASGIALFVSALSVWYRDVHFVVHVALQLLLYLSPIGYSLESVPPRFRAFVAVNPLAPLFEAIRWSLLDTGRVGWGQVAYAAGFAVAVFLLGLATFRLLERRFSDVV